MTLPTGGRAMSEATAKAPRKARREMARATLPPLPAKSSRDRLPWRIVRFVFVLCFAILAGLLPGILSHDLIVVRSVHFEHRVLLLLLLLTPLIAWATTGREDARRPRVWLATTHPLAGAPIGLGVRLRDVPGALRCAAFALGVAALARPQNPLSQDATQAEGIDIVVALDLSTSMEAVMDGDGDRPAARAEPRPTRLDTAKDVIVDFIARRRTDRIGVVVFGRAAYVLAPLTLDRSMLTQMVRKMDLNLVNGNGTAIGDAVGTAVARLRRSTAKSKVVILLTDGDSNAGSVSPDYATRLAKDRGIAVYTVQIGTGDEVDVQRGTDFNGEPRYVRARYPVNPELLQRMAKDTGGEAFIAKNRLGLQDSMHRILDRLERSQFESARAPMEELFPSLLYGVFALLALEALARFALLRRFP
jgi:Ca-activated chloride channel family protein